MSEKEKGYSVMTPVFEGTRYLHHVCSECKGTLEFDQSIWGGISFYTITHAKCESVKFCPLCGAEIIRFSDKPIYEAPIDLRPLDVVAELHAEYERKAKWLYNCYISDSHKGKIDALMPLIKKGDVSVYYQKALDLASIGNKYGGVSYQTRKKVLKEFGEETENGNATT